MIRRVLAIAVLLVAFVAAPASAADNDELAGGYDGATCTVDFSFVDGQFTINLQCEGFNDGATVTITVTFDAAGGPAGFRALPSQSEPVQTGTVQANSQGEYDFEVENQGAGEYTVVATDGENTATTSFTVTEAMLAGDTGTDPASPATPTQSDEIAFTGSNGSLPMAQVGVVLVVLGALAVYVAKRRRGQLFSD